MHWHNGYHYDSFRHIWRLAHLRELSPLVYAINIGALRELPLRTLRIVIVWSLRDVVVTSLLPRSHYLFGYTLILIKTPLLRRYGHMEGVQQVRCYDDYGYEGEIIITTHAFQHATSSARF